jgi:hypothetical protein
LYRGKILFAERQDRLSRLGNIETTLLFYKLLSAGAKIRLTEEHRTIKDINDLTSWVTQ